VRSLCCTQDGQQHREGNRNRLEEVVRADWPDRAAGTE
jgi:hypothetical protein